MSEETDWMRDGLCRTLTTEQKDRWFFPERGAPTGPAKRICAECEVREECLEYTLAENMRHGIWGMTSERERRKLRTTRSIIRWTRCRQCEKRFCWEMRGGQQPIYCSKDCQRASRVSSQRNYEQTLRNAAS